MKRSSAARKREIPADTRLEPKLVLPQENSDQHPLIQKYAKLSQTALKNSPPNLDAEAADDPPTLIG